MIFNFGNNDLRNYTKEKCYVVWYSMIRRCYSEVYQKTKPTYIGCTVHNDWRLLSNFRVWFDSNYVEGWQLDKDLLGNGKLYSENTCCFLPACLNSLIVESNTGILPGVTYNKARKSYIAQISYFESGKRSSGHLCL